MLRSFSRHAVARRACWRAGRALSVDDKSDRSAKSADIEVVDSGAARIDFGRTFRTGVPEVIFGEGKSTEHLLEIFTTMAAREHRADGGGPAHAPVMATRVSAEKHGALLAAAEAAAAAAADADADAGGPAPRTRINEAAPGLRPDDLEYHAEARIVALRRRGAAPAAAADKADKRGARRVTVVSAGTSDHPISEECAVALELSGCAVERVYDCGVAGLDRLLSQLAKLRPPRARVVVVVAGMDGALPAVVAGLTRAPVIAVPTSVGYGAAFEGLAPLLTMMNACAPGVAVVNIDNGFGAAALALKILGVNSGAARKPQPQSGAPKKQQPPRARDKAGRAAAAGAAATGSGGDDAPAAATASVEEAADGDVPEGATSELAEATAEAAPPNEHSASTDADQGAADEQERQRELLQRWREKEAHA